MSTYRFSQVHSAEEWDELVGLSKEGSIFLTSTYLNAIGRPYSNFFVSEGDVVKGGVSLIPGDSDRTTELDNLLIYNGILFRDDSGQKPVKRRMERFEITEFILDKLDQRFDAVSMSLSPEFDDLRPFLWHNYSSENPADQDKTQHGYARRLRN